MPTLYILVKGKVQGVYFRASARKQAQSLRLTGWVRNTPDGDVEALVSGKADDLQSFKDWCHQGPSGARVDAVHTEPREEGQFTDFQILR